MAKTGKHKHAKAAKNQNKQGNKPAAQPLSLSTTAVAPAAAAQNALAAAASAAQGAPTAQGASKARATAAVSAVSATPTSRELLQTLKVIDSPAVK